MVRRHGAGVTVDGVGGVERREHLRGVRTEAAVLGRDGRQRRHRHARDLLQHRLHGGRVGVQLHLVRGSGGRLRGAAERLAVDRRRLRVTVDAVRLEQTARCHRHRHW